MTPMKSERRGDAMSPNGMRQLAPIVAAVCAFGALPAAANPAMEGTWKIASPQVALRTADGGPIPFTESGRKQYEANKAAAARRDYEAYDLTQARCSSPGLPRLMLTPARFRIFVRADAVTMMFEWNRLLRQVNLREKPSEPDWGTVSGRSWGHWDGLTLVVESSGFNHKKLLDNLLPDSDELQLLERLQLKDWNTLEDRITITDPQMFERPWDTVITYRREPDAVFPEDVCLDRKAAGQLPLPSS
jgi:hypothetical protein